MNIIQANNIIRMFPTGAGEFYALKGVDVEIPQGKLTILKGRSGSGKTTLMNILSTLDAPTDGNVIFDGQDYRDITELEKEQLRRNEIGFVFQAVALIPIMNAYENVDFAMRLAEADLSPNEVDARIRETLALVGMEERMLHLPGQMSGGEQQRVAIARAVAHRPKVIFADEPTGALDTETGLRVMKLFRDLIEKEGVTIVMTTHDPNLMELGDVVYELEDGEIIDRQIRG
ncbi:MAG: ABC transporter ATP-binding protein [Wujia sp.]|nr:ATP-binding cassette domain-containing protein [Wujia sp.]MCI6240558.1 ABC transporter ATP-binding protein [Clostridium sp.]MDD7282673.1 ABC transporter ATP-binding protein [Clostridium sp.]MDY3726872.1 ABC transporter ATP-binding protein [Wujia sp.]